MSARSRLVRLSMVAGVAVMVLFVAACAIKLRDDEEQASSASSVSSDADPLAAELARCRRVTPAQTDALEACRRLWAEQRRQFLGQPRLQLQRHIRTTSRRTINRRRPRREKRKVACRRDGRRCLPRKASEPWVAPASSIVSSGFSPNISTADLGCFNPRWPSSPPR